MDTKSLRRTFLEFYQKRNHRVISSASLLPENDPTVLFTTAGMHPLVPFLMGARHPEGRRLVNVQKCIRTQDIDDVGDAWHGTFFEMLGYWSLGDYFKEEAITGTLEFLTKVLGYKPERLAATVFRGDAEVPGDEESWGIWHRLGFPQERIFRLGKADNFWGPVGNSGPCGPCSETFYITRDHCVLKNPDCSPACKCGRYVELCNNVFMELEKIATGGFKPLPQRNVDFGMGLIRVVSTMNGAESVYESDVFKEAMGYLQTVAPDMETKNRRIIADHLQAAMFAISDTVVPSNVGAGYVVRRLLRRAFRLANQAKIDNSYVGIVVRSFAEFYGDQYPETAAKAEEIVRIIQEEEEKFVKALGQGLRYFERELHKVVTAGEKSISGKTAFYMFETFGFPLEVTQEIARESSVGVDVEGYNAAFAEHQEKSRMAGDKLFKGGLADNSEQVTKLHTATHLLHEALRRVLGSHVEQRGSNITPERLRFDFSHPEKMTVEQIKAVETLVNEQINKNLRVSMENMTVDAAKASGAIGLFESKYDAKVNVYTIGDFSREICGGPHVEHLGVLGKFTIQKEEASSRGVRRIKAVLG